MIKKAMRWLLDKVYVWIVLCLSPMLVMLMTCDSSNADMGALVGGLLGAAMMPLLNWIADKVGE